MCLERQAFQPKVDLFPTDNDFQWGNAHQDEFLEAVFSLDMLNTRCQQVRSVRAKAARSHDQLVLDGGRQDSGGGAQTCGGSPRRRQR